MNEPVISISSIKKRFNEVVALDGISFDVKKGIFGLIGPNGAGKTTLLRILFNLIKPDAGTGMILGFDINNQTLAIRSRVGILHEKPYFPTNMTPFKYLTRIANLYGSTSNPDKVLKNVDLHYARNRAIGNLSAGMYQRLGIAQAIIGNPEVVFLDEPTSNLDVDGREDLIQLIINLHQDEGMSFYISSHILSEIERACNHVGFINRGRIIEVGETREIIKKYTESSFRIVTSDSRKLLEVVQDIPTVIRATISGINTVTLKIEPATCNDTKEMIRQIAEEFGLCIYAFEVADTLDETYKSIISDKTV
jgi:ABC-2 type transport system ATP-binding protein